MIPKYKQIYEFVLSNNEPLVVVEPIYKVTIHYYDNTKVFLTKTPSEVDTTSASSVEINIDNIEDYGEYTKTVNLYNQRAEYIWYLLLKEQYKHLEEKVFLDRYKECWDKYHKNGG